MEEARLAAYVPRMLLEPEGFSTPGHWRVQGSLLFCDISGFTRLSEKLARQGKAGAEELVTHLSSVYTSLLTATDDGGDVLKFSGDAMVIFFSGDDHAARAAHCAHGMRRALTEVGRIDCSHGRVRLRMSNGIHSGDFYFFCCGGDQLELLAAGPGVSATVAMESAADAGEVLLSASAAAAINPAWLGKEKSGGVLLRRPAHLSGSGAPPHPQSPDATAERYIPCQLRHRIGHAGAENDHRRATIAFLQFKGTDALLATEGAAELYERLQALTLIVQECSSRYGVCVVATDIDADGGKFMLTAGAPEANEDDEGRMLRACLEILDADAPLPIRIGVNRGYIFAGDVGAPFRRTYSTMGDNTNLAARIMGKAPMGGLLAHRSVTDAAPGFFVQPVPAFTVKGKSQPVEAGVVHALGVAMEAGDPELPLIGRDAEMETLHAAERGSRTGPGTVVELVGDPGVGKSRLLAALCASVADRPVLQVTGDVYDRSTAYATARVLLRTALAIPPNASRDIAAAQTIAAIRAIAPDLEPLAGLLAPVVGADLPEGPAVADIAPRFRQSRTHAVVTALMAGALPTAVIAVDDAMWIDEASAALLGALLRRTRDRHWLVVVARRDEASGLHHDLGYRAEELRVGPLGRSDVDELLRELTDERPLPPRTLDAIAERSAGNPLFLLELAASARADDTGTLPSSVEAIVASRIDQLSVADRQALRSVAVLGVRFPSALLDEVLWSEGVLSDNDALWDRLSPFVTHQPDGSFAFRSALHRDTAYEGLTFSRRRELHGRVAESIARGGADGPEVQAALSWHLYKAERWQESWQHSVRAGDHARSLYAHAEAADAYRRALHAAKHLTDVTAAECAHVGELLGDAEELASRYTEAAAAYQEARRRVGDDPLATARLLRKEGVVGERAGRYPAALRCYGRALSLIDGVEASRERSAVRAQLGTGYAAVRFRQGKLEDCVEWTDSAAADAAEAEDHATLAHAYYLLEAALDMLGSPRAAEVRGRALPLYVEVGDLLGQGDVLNNLGVTAYYEGRWTEALALYQRSRDAFRRVGDDVAAATAANNIAEILSDQGRLGEAERLLREALAVWRSVDYTIGVALAISNLGRLALRGGRPLDALAELAEALRRFTALGSSSFVNETRLRIAEAYLALGRSVEAWEAATDARSESGDGPTKATAERLRGLALIQTGGVERGLGCLRAALEQARELGADYEVALCLDALARHDTGDGLAHEAEAAAIFARLGVETPVAHKGSGGATAPSVGVVLDDREREASHAPSS